MSRRRASALRTTGIIAAAILIAVLSVRDWAARAPRSHPMAALAHLWPGHPTVAVEEQLVQAALAAKANRSLGPEQRLALRHIVKSAPLEPEPFMLEGAVAQLEGNTPRALQLYRAARLRDPRDTAARLLLADLELRSGQVEAGLSNFVAITRLEPKKVGPVITALAEYARLPGSATEMRRVFKKNPSIGGVVLMELAGNLSNLALVRALNFDDGSDVIAPWEERLIQSALAARDYALAHQLWIDFNRLEAEAGEAPFNPGFEKRPAGPPFNWVPEIGNAGVAEFRPGGGLSIVHFGREPMIMVRQLLLLRPGKYAIATQLERTAEPGRLEWRVKCASSDLPPTIGIGVPRGTFEAVSSCQAYWLELHALAGETVSQFEGTLTRAELRRVP